MTLIWNLGMLSLSVGRDRGIAWPDNVVGRLCVGADR
jgi:hypothetical protein